MSVVRREDDENLIDKSMRCKFAECVVQQGFAAERQVLFGRAFAKSGSAAGGRYQGEIAWHEIGRIETEQVIVPAGVK
jgi:hypothetical protein